MNAFIFKRPESYQLKDLNTNTSRHILIRIIKVKNIQNIKLCKVKEGHYIEIPLIFQTGLSNEIQMPKDSKQVIKIVNENKTSMKMLKS